MIQRKPAFAAGDAKWRTRRRSQWKWSGLPQTARIHLK